MWRLVARCAGEMCTMGGAVAQYWPAPSRVRTCAVLHRHTSHTALQRSPHLSRGRAAARQAGAGRARQRGAPVREAVRERCGAGRGRDTPPARPSLVRVARCAVRRAGGRPAVRLNCTAPAGPCGATHLTGSLQQILTVPPTNHTTNPPHAGPQLEERGYSIKLG